MRPTQLVLAVFEVLVHDSTLSDTGVRAALIGALKFLIDGYDFILPAEGGRWDARSYILHFSGWLGHT